MKKLALVILVPLALAPLASAQPVDPNKQYEWCRSRAEGPYRGQWLRLPQGASLCECPPNGCERKVMTDQEAATTNAAQRAGSSQ